MYNLFFTAAIFTFMFFFFFFGKKNVFCCGQIR